MAQDNRSFETTLHDIVYSIDTGTGLKIIRVGLYVLILLAILMVYTATQFRGLTSAEAMDYAQLARNFSLKNGMTTKCIRPMTMWKMAQRNPDGNPQISGHPDVLHPPAYPIVLSTVFKLYELAGIDIFTLPEDNRAAVMRAEQWAILPINHIFTLLTGWFVFKLGQRLFSREIGFLGMTIYYLSDCVWQSSISGLNISMAGFFTAASFYTMVVAMLNRRDREESRKVLWLVPYLLSVVLAAVAFLTRYISIAIVPGICLFTWLMAGRFRGGTRFVLIYLFLFFLLISPWLVRNHQVSGNPFGMVVYSALADTPQYSGNAVERDYHPDTALGSTFTQLKKKWILKYSGPYSSLIPGLGGGLLTAFFLTTFFYQFVRPQVNYVKWTVGLSLLLMVVLAGFFSDSSAQMLNVFWPFIILYGLAFFYILLDRFDFNVRLYSIGLKCLIIVLSVIPFGLTLMPPHKGNPYPPYHAPLISSVSGWLTPREVMCTDMPWATAWYGDRVSILLPKDLDQFYEINDYKQYISGLYITTITKNRPFAKDLLDGSEKSWLPVIGGRMPPDFPLKEGIAPNRQDQLFLSDRDRWSIRSTGGVPESQ